MSKVSAQPSKSNSANVYSWARRPSKRRQLKLIRQYRHFDSYRLHDFPPLVMCEGRMYLIIQLFFESLRRNPGVPTLAVGGPSIRTMVKNLLDPEVHGFFDRMNRPRMQMAFSDLIDAAPSVVADHLEVLWPNLPQKATSRPIRDDHAALADKETIEHTCLCLRQVLGFIHEFPIQTEDAVVMTKHEWSVRSVEVRTNSYTRKQRDHGGTSLFLDLQNRDSRYCKVCSQLTEIETERRRLLCNPEAAKLDASMEDGLRRGFPMIIEDDKGGRPFSYQLCAKHSKSGSGMTGYQEGNRRKTRFLALLRLMGHSAVQVDWSEFSMDADLREIADELYQKAKHLPECRRIEEVVYNLYSPYPGTDAARLEARRLMQEILLKSGFGNTSHDD